MKPAVLKAFWDFTVAKEGYLDFMYADVLGLVTTGVGNLIDSSRSGSATPWAPALSLPWKHRATKQAASQAEIIAAWKVVKSRTDLDKLGGGHFRGVTDLYLEPQAIQNLVDQRLTMNETILRQRYPGYDSWPADAQLALHSMAWAAGPAFNFPAFAAAVNKLVPDFAAAAKAAHMKNLNKDRQQANFDLFTNAAAVLKGHFDPNTLYYPGIVKAAGLSLLGLVALGGAGYVGYRMVKKS